MRNKEAESLSQPWRPGLTVRIVLFIAAPPIVRAVFRIPEPGRRRAARAERKAVAA